MVQKSYKTLTNQAFQKFLRAKLWRIDCNLHRKSIKGKRLEGKTLTNRSPFVKFVRLLHRQSFGLFGILSSHILKALTYQTPTLFSNECVVCGSHPDNLVCSLTFQKSDPSDPDCPGHPTHFQPCCAWQLFVKSVRPSSFCFRILILYISG